MYSAGKRSLTISHIAVASVVLLTLYLLRESFLPHGLQTDSNRTLTPAPTQQMHFEKQIPQNGDLRGPSKSPSESCTDAPDANHVMLLLKTGATELYQKLPAHFVTTFRCTPRFMIFSDLEQSFGEYSVHDALASIGEEIRDQHPDFELYRKLQQYQREGQDLGQLQGAGGWNLDKWKFLPMMHKAFVNAEDDIEWFVMIEADTSLSWTNLLQYLKTMNSSQPWYTGSQNLILATEFAHGGSGIVVSRKAADMLEDFREHHGGREYDSRWEEHVRNACCGDEVIARAFMEANVPLTPAWPLIQGETLSTVDWTDKHWCSPPITWHHVSPIELDQMWQFESSWVNEHGWNEPYLFRDVFNDLIQRHVTVTREAWNNLSKDRRLVSAALANADDDLEWSTLQDYEKDAVESPRACEQACLRKGDDECIQWMFSPGRCYLGKDLRFGKSDERESDHWTSGWIQERVEKFKDRFKDCEVRWPS